MPIKFYGYAYARNDESALNMEKQQALIWKEFNQQKATGRLPADAEWSFVGDTERKRTVKFLHRPMGMHLFLNVKPGDRICVSSHDRIIGSTVGATETLDWAIDHNVHLVFLDLGVDSSTPHGRHTLEVLHIVKCQERRDHSRRQVRDIADRRRSNGLAVGNAPLGYEIKTIIPIGGGPKFKHLFPWVKERQHAMRIVQMHDEMGLSFRQIAIQFWKHKIIKPRSGQNTVSVNDVRKYYHRCKDGWPLPGGVRWRPPDFSYKAVRPNVIDLNKID